MLIVMGYIQLPPPDVASFISDMEVFSDAARARDGCLFFAVASDDPRTGRMLVVERWRDQATLNAHLAAEDTAAFVARWHGRMSGTLTKFDALNQRVLTAP